jgi:hypothetical protein
VIAREVEAAQDVTDVHLVIINILIVLNVNVMNQELLVSLVILSLVNATVNLILLEINVQIVLQIFTITLFVSVSLACIFNLESLYLINHILKPVVVIRVVQHQIFLDAIKI